MFTIIHKFGINMERLRMDTNGEIRSDVLSVNMYEIMMFVILGSPPNLSTTLQFMVNACLPVGLVEQEQLTIDNGRKPVSCNKLSIVLD